jgi:hypothetical protein
MSRMLDARCVPIASLLLLMCPVADAAVPDSATYKQIGCVIAHEIMHVWGADENAADAMVNGFSGLPANWECP